MKIIMIAVTLLLTSAAYAEGLSYYERPSFMAESMPLKIDCVMKTNHYGNCLGNYQAPESVVVKVSDSNGQNVRVTNVNPLIPVSCQQSICSNDRTGEPVGEVDMSKLAPSYVINWTMIDGYYLIHDPKTGVWAYKRGFGPKGDKYPQYAIYTESGSAKIAPQSGASGAIVKLNHPESQTYSNAEIWPVWCATGKSTCDVAGQTKDKKQLFKEMPVASWGYCQGDFCYGDDALSDVIGLNPARNN